MLKRYRSVSGRDSNGYQYRYVYDWEQDTCKGCTSFDFVQIPPSSLERIWVRKTASCLGLTIMIYYLLSSLLPLCFGSLFSRLFTALLPVIGYSPALMSLVGFVFYQLILLISAAAALLVPTLFYGMAIGIPFSKAFPTRRVSPGLMGLHMLVGLGLWAFTALLTFYIAAIFPLPQGGGLFSGLALPAWSPGFGISLVLVVVLPSLIGVLVFQGVLLQSLRRFGDGLAVLLSAFIYAVIQLDFRQVPALFLMGIFLGYVVLKSGCIWVAAALSLMMNLLWALMQFLPSVFPEAATLLITESAMILCLLAGLIGLIFLARRDERIFQLHPSKTCLSSRGKFAIIFSNPAFLAAMILTAVLYFYPL